MGRIIPCIMEHQKCSKPPTRTYLGTAVARSVMAAAWNFSLSSNNQNGIFWYDLGHDINVINRTCKSQTCGLSLNIGELKKKVCQTIIIPSYLPYLYVHEGTLWGYGVILQNNGNIANVPAFLCNPPEPCCDDDITLCFSASWLRKITCFFCFKR